MSLYIEKRKPANSAKRKFLWIFSVVMLVIAGIAFVLKLIEFFQTLSDPSNKILEDGIVNQNAFAVMPLVTYLLVASGFGCLLIWSYLSGHYKDVEYAKYRMLDFQNEFDQAEAAAKQKTQKEGK